MFHCQRSTHLGIFRNWGGGLLFKKKGDVLMVFFCQIIFSDGRRSSKANPCQFVGWLSTWGGKEGKMGVLVLSSPELFQCIKAIKNSHECHVFFCSFLSIIPIGSMGLVYLPT